MCRISCGSDTSGDGRIPTVMVSHPVVLNRVVIPEVRGPPGSPAGSWAPAAFVVWRTTAAAAALVYQPGRSYETDPQ